MLAKVLNIVHKIKASSLIHCQVGRKPLLLVSGVAMTIFVALAATLILVFDLEDLTEEQLSEEKKTAGYVVVILVVVFMCIFSFSYG